MKKGILIILCFWISGNLLAQSPIGEFSSHIPLRSFFSVAAADDYIYAATTNGLMLLDKTTLPKEQVQTSSWSKVDGLSDINLSKIHYDKLHKTLIIGYNNGNLDFIKDDKLYNVSDVKDKSLSGSKELVNMQTDGDKLYLVYPFGIVIVDLNSLLIDDTWFTKRGAEQYQASDIAITDNRYYISTDKGIFSISKDYAAPANFLVWQQEATTENRDFDQLCYFGGQLFANLNSNNAETGEYDTLYVLSQGEWMPTDLSYFDVRSITVNQQEMAICNWDFVDVLNPDMTNAFRAAWYNDNNEYPNAQEAIINDDNIWVADEHFGLVQNNRTYYYHKYYTANGPYSYNTENMCSMNGIVATVPGGYSGSNYAPSYQHPAISWFSRQKWNYNSWDFSEYDQYGPNFDLVNIVINPTNEKEWAVASWGGGLFKCIDQRPVAHYTAANSMLDSTEAGKTFVSGLAYDRRGNLWMTNSQCSTLLKMMEPDGTWHKYNISSGVVTSSYNGVVAKHLLIDSRGYKWITFPRDDSFNRYHLVAFYEGNSYDNPGEYKFARIDMNVAAEVSSSTVNCVAEDLDGEIWIGTDKGVKVISHPSNIFNGNIYPRNVLLTQDGYVSVLLEFEEVTAIAVDGANRKWIGTSKAGVFLMSENGQQQLLHFTEEDNPLFSNQINSINIDQQSGEVFFGTSKGLVSYRGDAIRGFEHYEKDMLLVYPNPVQHDYTGPVAVKGMKEHSLCKITDASGKMIWQGYSFGGQLIWNCVDHFGKRPATGVYYVMASDEEGKEKVVAKFLFIN